MTHPSFIIDRSQNDQFHFTLTAKNGQVILTSEQYTAKASCQNGIDSVKRHSSDESNFERLTSKNNKYYFNLKASNGQVIGTSQMYVNISGGDNGIQSVMENAPLAPVDDRT